MARKSRKKKKAASNPAPVIIGAVCAVALVAGGIYVINNPSGTSSANLLSIDTYTTSPESQRGSTFEVRGEVIKKIAYKDGVRQVLQVRYNNEDIPIVVPADVDGPNINTQQEYTFTVNAKDDAWLFATAYTDK